MILSSEHKFLRDHVGEKTAIEILAKAGFDAIDYGFSPALERGEMWTADHCVEYAREVMRIAEGNGIYFNQAHGPFKFDTSLFPDYSREVLPLYQRCFEICAMLEIPQVVVHPVHHLLYRENAKQLWEMNLDFYSQLLPYAKAAGVKIAVENMCQLDPKRGTIGRDIFAMPKEFAQFHDVFDDPYLICCVDTGHSMLAGENVSETLQILGHRVKALHFNDNFYRTDDHVIPGQGWMDLEDVLRTLAEIGYEGDMTLEVLNLWRSYDPEFMLQSAKYLQEAGRYFIAKIEKYKKESGDAAC